MKQSGLGKGLSALISENYEDNANPAYIPNLAIHKIVPNPYQPRMHINEQKLIELADSIRENGVIEPLLVTKKSDDKYELIAGERRWRAAKLAKLETVPVIVKETSPQQMLELAVIENIQRADLNPLEEAMAFDQLVKEFNMTHAEIAQKVGFSRPAIANKMRLLLLPNEIKKGVLEETITEGHARALQGLTNPETMVAAYKKVVTQSLSVRATEELVRRLNVGVKQPKRSVDLIIDSKTTKYETGLRTHFENKKIRLTRSLRGGRIEIPFKTDEELAVILERMGIPD